MKLWDLQSCIHHVLDLHHVKLPVESRAQIIPTSYTKDEVANCSHSDWYCPRLLSLSPCLKDLTQRRNTIIVIIVSLLIPKYDFSWTRLTVKSRAFLCFTALFITTLWNYITAATAPNNCRCSKSHNFTLRGEQDPRIHELFHLVQLLTPHVSRAGHFFFQTEMYILILTTSHWAANHTEWGKRM